MIVRNYGIFGKLKNKLAITQNLQGSLVKFLLMNTLHRQDRKVPEITESNITQWFDIFLFAEFCILGDDGGRSKASDNKWNMGYFP